MAVVNTNSTLIANILAQPKVINPRSADGQVTQSKKATLEAVSGDSIGSTYRFFRLPSNAVIDSLKLFCDAITTCAGDVGLYQTTENGGAAADADLFASAQSLASAVLTGTELKHESGVAGVEKIDQPLWKLLGLSVDPNIEYDVVVTLTAAAGSAGTISLLAQYSDA